MYMLTLSADADSCKLNDVNQICLFAYVHMFFQYVHMVCIGCIGLVDHDVADLSNLHRQVLHKEDTIGKEKVDSAIAELKRY